MTSVIRGNSNFDTDTTLRVDSRNTTVNQEAVTQGTSTATGMSSTIYTGNGTGQSVTTGIDMSTGDFGGLVWVKTRNQPYSHDLMDSIRGAGWSLNSDSTSIDENDNVISSFDSTGFSAGTHARGNAAGNTYVAWSFQTNQKTTGTTNRNKAYTAHYNTDLGFSIVGYVGDSSSGQEIPTHVNAEGGDTLHIIKSRDGIYDWAVKSSLFGQDEYLNLNSTGALATNSVSKAIITDSAISIMNTWNPMHRSADDYIMYTFASKQGISKVGKYIGTGAAGNYVDCGFKVGWVMVKNLTSGSTDWVEFDSIRGDEVLYPNLSLAAQVASDTQLVDDGFFLNSAWAAINQLNNEYLFLAFAETNTDATKSWTDYTYPTTADTLSIQQNTLISFANGFNASGQVDTQENVGAGVTYALGAGHENKHYWLYKDKGSAYGVSEYRPLEGLTRNDADKWGEVSPLDSSLRTTAKHFDYESSTGVALASGEIANHEAHNAFDKNTNDIVDIYQVWATTATAASFLQYKGTEKRVLKSWRLRQPNTVNKTPDNFDIEGSNDGFTWTVIDSTYNTTNFSTVTNGSKLWSPLQSTVGNVTAYLYHRINISVNAGGTETQIAELEFNTILPSDYYLVNEGKMYNSSDVAIERTYLAELMTNDDGEVSWYTNLSVAKQRFNDVEVHNDLTVHGDISNRGVATAWVNFDGTQNPPLIRDSFNVKDVVDLGTGIYRIIYTNQDRQGYSLAEAGRNGFPNQDRWTGIYDEGITSCTVQVQFNSGVSQADASVITVTRLGGK